MSLVLQSAFSKMCRVSARFLPTLTSSFSAQVDSVGINKPPPPKSVNDVPKIRRPLSPFAVFMQSQYGKLKKENPASKATDVMKLASGLYAKLPQEEKKRLVDAAHSDRQRYEADLKQLTEEQRSQLSAMTQKKRHSRAIKQRRRQWRATGRPVRPINAPLLFMKERWPTRGTRKVTEFVRDVMAEWRALPEEQKEKYRKIEAEAKKKFEEDHTAWQAKLALEKTEEKVVAKAAAKKAAASTTKKPAIKKPTTKKSSTSKPKSSSSTTTTTTTTTTKSKGKPASEKAPKADTTEKKQ